jgi:spermidine/putrescine transport system substrate-binding protein
VLNAKPGTYDVIMHDPEVIQAFKAADGLLPMSPKDYPAAERDFFPQFKPSGHFPLHWYGNKMLALGWAFAYSSMSFNTSKFTREQATNLDIWGPKVEDKVGWGTWWLNALSTISLKIGVDEGWWKPFKYAPLSLTNAQYKKLENFVKTVPVDAVHGFYGIGDGTQALANEEIYIFPGGGFTISGSLQAQGKPFSDVVPKQGGVMYTESLSIAKGSNNVEAAKQFINYCISPEGCARKGILPAYQGIPVSRAAWAWIAKNDPKWVPRMRINLKGSNVFDDWKRGRIAVRRLPVNQSVEDWTNLWEEFKNRV